jgi:hypothetical protein
MYGSSKDFGLPIEDIFKDAIANEKIGLRSGIFHRNSRLHHVGGAWCQHN